MRQQLILIVIEIYGFLFLQVALLENATRFDIRRSREEEIHTENSCSESRKIKARVSTKN